MCDQSCIDFIQRAIRVSDVSGKAVLEVGSCNVNGSVRPYIESLKCRSYLGVDIIDGPNVDSLCDAGHLADRFGEEAFDVVVSTEMLEHVEDWRSAVSNMKSVLRRNGLLVLTTRSRGFPFHGYPYDFWRFEIADLKTIFSDFDVEVCEADSGDPGVFICARKPVTWEKEESAAYEVYSIVANRRIAKLSHGDITRFKLMYRLSRFVPKRIRSCIAHYVLGR